MSIERIRLRNFRGYSDATLELKPLTVLLGPNSSGKSSFSQPLAALSHCQTLYEGRRDANLTPRTAAEAADWPVDLGGFRDIATSRVEGKVWVGMWSNEGWVEFGFGLPDSPDLPLSQITLPHNLNVTGQSISENDGGDRGPTLAFPASGEVTSAMSPGQPADIPETRLVLERINEQQWRHGGEDATVGLSGLLPLSVIPSTGSEIPLNRKALTDITNLLGSLRYIRASRQRPSRGFSRLRGEQRSIGYSGEWTSSAMLAAGLKEGNYLMPPKRGAGVSDDFEVIWPQEFITLQGATAAWLKHFELAIDVRVSESEKYGKEYIEMRVTLGRGSRERDITEVGFAISQTVPVIVGSLLQPKDSLLLVDLPEAHLHPVPQGILADLFCALVKGGRSVIVETHSEMFFQRLRLRAAIDVELASQIAVYFIDAPGFDGHCNMPREVGLGFEDEVNWPSGFLTEAIDTELQIRSVRQVRSKHG